jgi:cephalosporin-C deacetylase-like acetyl esterase
LRRGKMTRNRFKDANREIDKYLDSLRYEDVVDYRADKLYDKIFKDIANIVIRFYNSLDLTDSMELSISTNTVGGSVSVNVTGYVKISEERCLHIEKTYLPKEVTV